MLTTEMSQTDYFNRDDYLSYLKTYQSREHISAQGRIAGLDLCLEMLNLLKIKPGDFTLEIGCGIGRIMHLLDTVFKADVYGCDISGPAIAHIREQESRFRERVYHCSGDQVDYLADACVDCLVTWGVFELTNQRRTLLEISRLLKIGGRALLSGVKNRAYPKDDADSLSAHQAYVAKSIPIFYTDISQIESLIRFLGMEIKHRVVFRNKQDLPKGKYCLDIATKVFSEAIYIIEKTAATPLDWPLSIDPKDERY